jgi:hypothetical protein
MKLAHTTTAEPGKALNPPITPPTKRVGRARAGRAPERALVEREGIAGSALRFQPLAKQRRGADEAALELLAQRQHPRLLALVAQERSAVEGEHAFAKGCQRLRLAALAVPAQGDLDLAEQRVDRPHVYGTAAPVEREFSLAHLHGLGSCRVRRKRAAPALFMPSA